MRPAISVVMPVYNRPELLINAINSILNQTEKNWELIIIDDGSELENFQKTQNIIQGLNDARIRLIATPHEGIVHARNLGSREAKADIIAMQDSDDLSLPDRLQKCLSFMPGVDCVYHGIYMNMWNKERNCINREYIPALPIETNRLMYHQYIPSAPFYRKEIWQKRPFRVETQYAFDWMMYLDWHLSGFKLQPLNIGLYEYVRQENSSSITFERHGLREQSIKAMRKILKDEYAED